MNYHPEITTTIKWKSFTNIPKFTLIFLQLSHCQLHILDSSVHVEYYVLAARSKIRQFLPLSSFTYLLLRRN